jgi:hypothetical protein
MINIDSAGRRKDGSLYVKAGEHLLIKRRTGRIDRHYHSENFVLPAPCCKDFERQARFELSGLQLLNQMMNDLEE